MAKNETKIVSIFGEIEGAVARGMCAQKLVHLIEPEMIPVTARYHEETGDRADCALVLTLKMEQEFDRRVALLRI